MTHLHIILAPRYEKGIRALPRWAIEQSRGFNICSCLSHFLSTIHHFAFSYIGDIQMEHLCQAGPTTGAPIDLPHLPRSVYAYGPNGFTREISVGRNTNVTGYPFLEGTQVVSSLLFFLYSSCISQPLS